MKVSERELQCIVRNAQLIMNSLCSMDDTIPHREIRYSLEYSHYSITYIPKNQHYHIYLEDGKCCLSVKLVDIYIYDNCTYRDERRRIGLKFKRSTRGYKEGTNSIILCFSYDYAYGPDRSKCSNATKISSWDTKDYEEFIAIYKNAPFYAF